MSLMCPHCKRSVRLSSSFPTLCNHCRGRLDSIASRSPHGVMADAAPPTRPPTSGQAYVRDVFHQFSIALTSKIPGNCRLDAVTCLAELDVLFAEGRERGEMVSTMRTRFHKSPLKYIESPDEYVSAVFKNHVRTISSHIPLGCELDRTKCCTELMRILRSSVSEDVACARLQETVRRDPIAFIADPESYLSRLAEVASRNVDRKAAEAFSRIQLNAAKHLPQPCKLKATECVALLRDLVKDQNADAPLEVQFWAQVHKTPQDYIYDCARYFETQANKIYMTDVASKVPSWLPIDWEIDVNSCQLEISKLLASGKSPQCAVIELQSRLTSCPKAFVKNLKGYLQSRAKRICDEVVAPFGYSLNQDKCIKRVSSLLANLDTESMVNVEFANELRRDEKRLFSRLMSKGGGISKRGFAELAFERLAPSLSSASNREQTITRLEALVQSGMWLDELTTRFENERRMEFEAQARALRVRSIPPESRNRSETRRR